jgi:inosose dehydratase
VREEAGVGLVVHHHAAGFLETEAEIERLLADTDPERVGLCLDTGHLAFGGGDPVAFARRHAARVRHLHLKDVDEAVAARVRRDGLDYLEAVRAGVFTTLGEGGVDVGGVLDALAGAPIGWAVVEHDRLSEDGPSPLESARTSRARLAALGLGASGPATREGAR